MGKELVTPFQKFEILSHQEYQHNKLAVHGKQRENNRWSASEKFLYLDQASQVSLSFFSFSFSLCSVYIILADNQIFCFINNSSDN